MHRLSWYTRLLKPEYNTKQTPPDMYSVMHMHALIRNSMRIFNTFSGEKEVLVPLTPGQIKMYSCGPTVYRSIHIGNLRTFCMADWLRRTLLRRGYAVQHIKNITDVGHMRVERLDAGEDKLLAQARKERRSAVELAAFFTASFLEDERRLNILPADRFPRATEHIPDMITLIERLERKELAYNVGGNVYFDVRRFLAYGALSGNLFAGLQAGVQENPDDAKRNAEDFPLWKVAEPGREMAWDSPWGRGFPGWHIECSAMATRYLGEQFDIHTGGVDNIFPHHENEIAQSEGATGHRWVSYWVHAQHLLTDGLKMSKSTGNDYTLADMAIRGYDPLALRYLFTSAHYRSRLNFSFTALTAAQTALVRLRLAARQYASEAQDAASTLRIESWQTAFDAALDDDLNLPQALAVVWNMVRAPRNVLSGAERCALLQDWDRVLGLNLFELVGEQSAHHKLPDLVVPLLEQRAVARAARDYATADRLRAAVREAGFEIQDTRHGSLAVPRRPGAEFPLLVNSQQAPNRLHHADRYTWSINVLARNNREDLLRCLASIAQHAHGQNIEVVVIDNGSTDDTLAFLQGLARNPLFTIPDGAAIPVQVLFADHNLGFAGGRNTTMRASTGRYVVLLDTSIELADDIWTPLAAALEDPTIGVAGPYGLVTSDLRDFVEAPGPDVDAIEGYLLAFRRDLLPEVGPIDEKFRFYRLADIYWSFFFKAAGLRAVALAEVARGLIKHPHREWYSLAPEEQRAKSKKNFDLFRDRWHHGESLLVANASVMEGWMSHNDPRHVQGTHMHTPDELPPPGQPHTHVHRHRPDHEHAHAHYHEVAAVVERS